MNKIYSGIEVEFVNCTGDETGVIYLMEFPNGKVYIGQTIKTITRRLIQHCNSKTSFKINNAIRKYKSIKVTILESNLNISQLNSFEQFYIKLFNANSDDGYNLDSGGLNRTRSDETRSKISESHKGLKVSDDVKRKISESNKGKKASDDAKHKISQSHKGLKASDETKSKLKQLHFKKVKSIPDNIIFESITEAQKYYNIAKLSDFYNGKYHKKSGQTFVLLED